MARRIIAIIVLLFVSCSLYAEDYTWNNSAGGLFGDENNWNPIGIPGFDNSDNINFTLPNSYTVTLDDSYSTQALYIDGSQVTLNIAGFSYASLLAHEYTRAVTIADTGRGTLRIINGPVYSREVVIGQQTDSAGNLVLAGTDASWTTMYDENWHGVYIGDYGDANLFILDNAKLYHGHGNSAFGEQSDVKIDVNGTDSYWYVDGQFDMSISGKTIVNISNGGLFEVGKLTMALYPTSSAQINITGQNHETELQVRNSWENFVIGRQGSASVKVYGSKIWNTGKTVLAELPASSGTLEIHQGSWVDCANSVAVGGSFDSAGGIAEIKITRDNPDDQNGVLFTAARTNGQFIKVWPNGTINMDYAEINLEYGDWLANPIILQGGTLSGNGMIWAHVQNLGGTVEPWDDLANKNIEIGYDYTQNAAGTLKIKIAGREGYEYAQLRAVQADYGNVMLDGILDIDFINGFTPTYDDVFEIITAKNITGVFNNAVTRYVFENGSFEIIYNNGQDYDSVILTHYSTELSCPKFPRADFNKDCKVNMIDFAVFAEEWLMCNLSPASYCD